MRATITIVRWRAWHPWHINGVWLLRPSSPGEASKEWSHAEEEEEEEEEEKKCTILYPE